MINKTLIIAEAGVNHNGDLEMAKSLIGVAAECGADIVKFQTFNASRLTTSTAQKANYQKKLTDSKETQYEMLSRLELSEVDHLELIAHCKRCGIKFLSTGFDVQSINFLAGLGQDLFKVPSGEITNLPYLRHIGRFGKLIYLSTGMSTLGDVEAALNTLVKAGTPRSNITILHCTTEYPAPIEEVNLMAMKNLERVFGVPIGYSDHTEGIEIAIAAVAMGATVIEKHFTLDRSLSGPDHMASIEPAQLSSMVKAIRNIEKALGSGIKNLTPSEQKNKDNIRKSIVANTAIRIGEAFSEHNLTTKRPGTGISPMRWDEVIGLKARRDFLPDELIQL